MFPGPDSMGLVWGGVGAFMHFMHFSAIFALLVVLAAEVPTLRGASSDAVTVYAS